MKRINLIYTLIASTILLTNCKKNEISQDKLLNNNSEKTAVAGDEKWDVLGYGYDATGDYLHLNSVKTLPVIDVDKFNEENKGKIYMPTTTSSPSGNYYYGSTASEFVKDVNIQRKFDASASYGSKDTLKTGGQFFSASFSKDRSNQSIKNTASRFSYARYEENITIKRVQFTDDIDVNVLKNYTTSDFKTHINTKTPQEIIRFYGTHVLMGVDLGGRLSFTFSATIASETSQEKKVEKVQNGLGFFTKLFGINISAGKTTEELTKTFNETRERYLNLSFFGGTNSGRSITFDSNANSSETINIASWQQSISPKNCALTDIRKMVPLYHFVNDPIKKAQLKADIELNIKDNQVTELGEKPVYSLYYDGTKLNKKPSLDNHVLSMFPSIEDPKMVNEGIMFYAFDKQQPGTIPVYRYRDDKNNNNFFTTKQSNYNGFTLGGIVFYVFASQSSSFNQKLTPIYRYWSNYHQDHYYTPVSANYLNYIFEKVEFYAIKAEE